ncbi:MAG: hypothetical protein WD077_01425 [Bacteroidia bacterium]
MTPDVITFSRFVEFTGKYEYNLRMDAIDKKILNNYLRLLEQLSPAMKLNLIEQLKESVKSRIGYNSKIQSSYGAWDSEESAEDIIEKLRTSRNTNRRIEEF